MVFALATKEYMDQLDSFVKTSNIEHTLIPISPYQLNINLQVVNMVLKEWKEDHIIVNYTGGTKIMALSAVLNVFLESHRLVELVYINTDDMKVEQLFINDQRQIEHSETDLEPNITIHQYFQITGESIESYINDESKNLVERASLSIQLLKNRKLTKIFSNQKSFFDIKEPKKEFHEMIDDVELSWNLNEFSLKTPTLRFSFHHSDGGNYFTGNWLEELVFHKLYKSKLFDECLMNLKIKYKDEDNLYSKNEVDVAVRKGIKTAFIECKAGSVTQEYVYKLSSITRHYLGIFGKPILFVRFLPKPYILEKCLDLGITVLSPNDFDHLENYIVELLN
jgi:hypothetical protein